MSEGYICSLSEPLIINIGQGTGASADHGYYTDFLIVIFAFILSQTVFEIVKAVGEMNWQQNCQGSKK